MSKERANLYSWYMCCASGSLRKLTFSNLPVSEVTFWDFPGVFWQICCHGPLGVLLWCSSSIYRLWSEMDGFKSELRCGYGLQRNATEGFCCCTFTTVEFLGTQYVISFYKDLSDLTDWQRFMFFFWVSHCSQQRVMLTDGKWAQWGSNKIN